MNILTEPDSRAADAGRSLLRGGLIFFLAHTFFVGLAVVLGAAV